MRTTPIKKATTIKQLHSYLSRAKQKKIFFVPTMGFLHEGHLQLVREAKKNKGFVVVSIFVNPLQFGPKEDLASYPRNIRRDQKLLEQEGVDLVFIPSVKEIYPEPNSVVVHEEEATQFWCGQFRPDHFKGVLTVVAKLLQLVQPDKAYFGQKDAQQLFLIEKMCDNLFFKTKIVKVPTVREEDGLAMSSRNTYLSQSQRKAALGLIEGLRAIRFAYLSGSKKSSDLEKTMKKVLKTNRQLKIQYIGFASQKEFKPIKKVSKGDVVLVAGFVGKTRLIDNWVIGEKL